MKTPHGVEVSSSENTRHVIHMMTDGSEAQNVEYVDPATAAKITFACTSVDHACRLKDLIDQCGWIEVDAP